MNPDSIEVMRAIDRMPPSWRALAHEYGATIVTRMHADNPRGVEAARADLEQWRARMQQVWLNSIPFGARMALRGAPDP